MDNIFFYILFEVLDFIFKAIGRIDHLEILDQERLRDPGKTEQRITIVSRSDFHREKCAVQILCFPFSRRDKIICNVGE